MGAASGGCLERGETGAGAAAAVATGKSRRGDDRETTLYGAAKESRGNESEENRQEGDGKVEFRKYKKRANGIKGKHNRCSRPLNFHQPLIAWTSIKNQEFLHLRSTDDLTVKAGLGPSPDQLTPYEPAPSLRSSGERLMEPRLLRPDLLDLQKKKTCLRR